MVGKFGSDISYWLFDMFYIGNAEILAIPHTEAHIADK